MSDSERIMKILEYLKMSKNKAGVEIGDKNGMRFQYVTSGRNKISEKFASDISNKFTDINYNWILNGDGPMLKNSIDENTTIKTKNGLEWNELPDGSFMVTVDMVPFEAHMKYTSEDVQEFQEWEKVSFKVEKIGHGNYKGFKHKGYSMYNPDSPGYYDVQDCDVSLCRELGKQHWKDGFRKEKAPYGWILVTNKNILHKDILSLNDESGEILCKSRNPSPEYPEFTLSLNDIYQIFKVITVNHNSKN